MKRKFKNKVFLSKKELDYFVLVGVLIGIPIGAFLIVTLRLIAG